MGIAGCHQESFDCYIPFVDQQYLVFSDVQWPISSQILGYLSSVRQKFHFVEWGLTKIKQWLVTPTTLCHYCKSMSYRQVIIVNSRVYSWVGSYLSPLVVCSIPSSTMNRSQQGGGIQVGSRLTSPCSMNCIGVVFSNEDLYLFAKSNQSIAFAMAGSVWRFTWGPFGQQLNCYNPFPALEVSLGGERYTAEVLSLTLFVDCIQILLIYLRRFYSSRFPYDS